MDPTAHALPDPDGFPWAVATDGPAATAALGGRLARLITGGEIILLHGDLGAGKTCLTQGLCKGLGVEGEVVSPTFTLVNTYRGDLVVHHLDFYRVEPGADLGDIGLPDILDEVAGGGAILVAEWPDRILAELRGFPLVAEWLGTAGPGPDDRTWRLRARPAVPESWRTLVGPAEGADGPC
ncbi:MAG: tRNA (adenosine(37)-N6)-threonylcarbamoyltransferase complex ATPase subunit type 1 TsaE [bacterium]|nr:tRNA (adenosine(37)-N6)-threonylcarbamoyltransferase complex ATPase subunit type 1 TsaE [bacterium]